MVIYEAKWRKKGRGKRADQIISRIRFRGGLQTPAPLSAVNKPIVTRRLSQNPSVIVQSGNSSAR